MVSGTTQKTEDFKARKNWVLGCGELKCTYIIELHLNYLSLISL